MQTLKTRSGAHFPVVMLVAAGTGALLFTVIAGALVYNSTRGLISAAAWVDHTHEVLSSLKEAEEYVGDIEQNIRLFSVTGGEEPLRTARFHANQLAKAAEHIAVLVSDNANQTANVGRLTICAADLDRTLDTLSGQSASLANQAVADQTRSCRGTLGSMIQQEQRLLLERSGRSQRSSYISFATESSFFIFSLLTLMTLFVFLVRDAVLRQRISRKAVLANEKLAQMVKALEEQAVETKLLTAFRDELQLCVDLPQVYHSAAQSFSLLLPQSSGSLAIINSSRNMAEVVSSWGVSAMGNLYPPESCCGLRSGQPRWREPGVSEINCAHFVADAPSRYLCCPIVAHGDTLGMLYVECHSDDACMGIRQRMDGLRQLLQLTGMAVASLNLRSKLESQSIRDPLTGLFNRHFMQIALERELSRATRRNSILAVFMLDVDHFKLFNDTWGHAAGDAVLKATGEVYLSLVRNEDIVCRYGGEEFTIILPDITPEAAYERAESIRTAVAALRVPMDKENFGEITVSIGIALYPNDGKASDHLLNRADQALYTAKRHGRNRVSFADANVLT